MATRDDVRINIIAETKQAVAGMAKFAAGIGAAIIIGRKLLNLTGDMVRAFGVQEQAQAKLEAAIKATGREAEISADSMFAYASSLQDVTTFGDEAIISATAMLQSFANLDEQGLQKVLPSLLDFSTALDLDLGTAATLIGKTLGSSTNALSRYGIELDTSADLTTKLAGLTTQLEEKFGGMAEKLAQTESGGLEQLSNILGDIKEQIGGLLLQGTGPIIDLFTNIAKAVREFLGPTTLKPLDEQLEGLTGLMAELRKERAQLVEDLTFAEGFFSKEFLQGEIIRVNQEMTQVLSVMGDVTEQLQEMEEAAQDAGGGVADLAGFTEAADFAVVSTLDSLQDFNFELDMLRGLQEAAGGAVIDMNVELLQQQMRFDRLVQGAEDYAEWLDKVRIAAGKIANAPSKTIPFDENDINQTELALDKLGESYTALFEPGVIDAFAAFNQAALNGATAFGAMSAGVGDFVDMILRSIPQMMFAAGVQLVMTGTPQGAAAGLALIAGSGLVSVLGGSISEGGLFGGNSPVGGSRTEFLERQRGTRTTINNFNIGGSVISDDNLRSVVVAANAEENRGY